MGNPSDNGLTVREIGFEDARLPVPAAGDKQRLLMQTLNEAQVDFLLQRTPRKEIKYRQGRGGMQFAYVEHGYVTERLNLVFGFNWDFEIVDKQILDEEVIVEARLTVRTPGGQTIVKTQFGGAEIKRHASGPRSGRPLSIADDYKAAASDALKKCSSLLGIGLDLYGRDRPEGVEADSPAALTGASNPIAAAPPEPEEPVQPPEWHGAKPGRAENPAGSTPALSSIPGERKGLCTQAQLRQISRLAAQAGMVASDLALSLGVHELGDLTEAKAQRVINRLLQLVTQVHGEEAS